MVYPNVMLQNTIPINLALLSACLKEVGFTNIKLFDTTLYRTQEISGDEIRANFLQFKKWDFTDVGVNLKDTDVFDEFEKTVREYDPHLISITLVEPTLPLTLQLLDRIKHLNKLTIAGGVLPTFSSDHVISFDTIDMICVGEGEKSMVELCTRLAEGKDHTDIPNLWVKTRDGIKKNPSRAVIDLNELPFLDFTIFEEQRFYRPNRGKIFKTLPVEMTRGCPYKCTFCSSPSWVTSYGRKWLRIKDMSRVMEEIKYQRDYFGMEFVYFSAEVFLALRDDEFNEFVERYEEINLPFWCQTRPETIRKDRIEKLQKRFDFRMSIGVESGSEKIRRQLLQRRISNRRIIEALEILNKAGVIYGVNNIIGFPDETREDIFDTIKLCREAHVKDINVFIFTPFRGTALRKLCLERGYVGPDHIALEHTFMSKLNMPQITKEEIYGLFRTFPLYVKLPEGCWPKIKRAEGLNEEGDRIYEDLAEIYRNEYQ
jgi:radical SAM superfamily enzyme YgiQ (UPF0313 family)